MDYVCLPSKLKHPNPRFSICVQQSKEWRHISQIWTYGLIIWWFQSDSSIIGLPLIQKKGNICHFLHFKLTTCLHSINPLCVYWLEDMFYVYVVCVEFKPIENMSNIAIYHERWRKSPVKSQTVKYQLCTQQHNYKFEGVKKYGEDLDHAQAKQKWLKLDGKII